MNNVAVAVSALTFAYMFAFDNDYQTLLMIVAVIVASISRVASEIQRVCFTKDWVVVISQAENIPLESELIETKKKYAKKFRGEQKNFAHGSPFISCSPFVDRNSFGLYEVVSRSSILIDLHGVNRTYVCIFIVLYNLASWVMESSILRKLYDETDELKSRRYEMGA